MTRRSASDAIKGTPATPAETPKEATPEAPKQDAPEATPDAPQTDAQRDTPQGIPAPETAPQPDPEDLEDADDFAGTVEVTVLVDQFHYFDEDGAHLSARKGDTVALESADAERAVRIGAAKASK